MSIDPTIFLPTEISLYIFSNFNQAELGRYSRVNSRWNALLSDNNIWKKIAVNYFGETPKTDNYKGFLKYYEAQHLPSNDAIIDRVQAFLERIAFGQNARLRCQIEDPTPQCISIEIQTNKHTNSYIPNSTLYNIYDYDFIEDYKAVLGIDDGSLQQHQPLDYCLKSGGSEQRQFVSKDRLTTIRPKNKPTIVFVMRFPNDQPLKLNQLTPLEDRLLKMLEMKYDQFVTQERKENSVLCKIAAAFMKTFRYVK